MRIWVALLGVALLSAGLAGCQFAGPHGIAGAAIESAPGGAGDTATGGQANQMHGDHDD